MARYTKQASNGSRNLGKAIVAVLLAVVLVVASCLTTGYLITGTANVFKWKEITRALPGLGGETGDGDNTGGSEVENTVNNVVLTPGEEYGIAMTAELIAPDSYSDYGIDPRGVQSAYTAKVTLANHSSATNKTINLDVKFSTTNNWTQSVSQNGATDLWARDYIQLSNTSVQSGETFTITCTQAFGAPILITGTAAGAEDGDTTATCSIQADYIARFGTDVTVRMGAADGRCDGEFDTSYDMMFTIDDGKTQRAPIYYNIWYNNYLEGDQGLLLDGFSLTCMYGVGTIKDTFISNNADNDWGVEFSAFSYGEEYDVENLVSHTFKESQAKINIPESNVFVYQYDRLWDIWESDFESDIQSFAGRTYSQILSNYNRPSVTVTMYITFKGAVTGETYRYAADMVVNPQYMYVPAQSPSFDIGNIVF